MSKREPDQKAAKEAAKKYASDEGCNRELAEQFSKAGSALHKEIGDLIEAAYFDGFLEGRSGHAEMLEALKQADAAFSRQARSALGPNGAETPLHAEHAAIRAAIAKAEGA